MAAASRLLLVLCLLIAGTLISDGALADGPALLWGSPTGAWATGPSGSTNQTGGGMLVEESWIDNAFYLVGTDQPTEVVWTMWADGVYVAGGGYSPWTYLRMYVQGSGWVSEEGAFPGTRMWEMDEVFGPPVGPDILHGVSVARRQVRFTAQPGVHYALRQQNLSRLNYFDLGYCQGTVTSSVELVPEPGSIALLATGLAGLLWPLRRKART